MSVFLLIRVFSQLGPWLCFGEKMADEPDSEILCAAIHPHAFAIGDLQVWVKWYGKRFRNSRRVRFEAGLL